MQNVTALAARKSMGHSNAVIDGVLLEAGQPGVDLKGENVVYLEVGVDWSTTRSKVRTALDSWRRLGCNALLRVGTDAADILSTAVEPGRVLGCRPCVRAYGACHYASGPAPLVTVGLSSSASAAAAVMMRSASHGCEMLHACRSVLILRSVLIVSHGPPYGTSLAMVQQAQGSSVSHVAMKYCMCLESQVTLKLGEHKARRRNWWSVTKYVPSYRVKIGDLGIQAKVSSVVRTGNISWGTWSPVELCSDA